MMGLLTMYRMREFKDMRVRAKEVKVCVSSMLWHFKRLFRAVLIILYSIPQQAAALSILETCHGVGRSDSQRAGIQANAMMASNPALTLPQLVPRIIATWTSIAWLGIA